MAATTPTKTLGLPIPFRANDGRPATRPSRAGPKSCDHAEQILSSERLANQRHSPVLRRQLLTPVAAHEGEGDSAREQRIGDLSHRLAAKIGIEQSAIDYFALERLQRVAH